MLDWPTIGTSVLASSLLASTLTIAGNLVLARRLERHQREQAISSHERAVTLKQLEHAQQVRDEKRASLKENLEVIVESVLSLEIAVYALTTDYSHTWHKFGKIKDDALAPVLERRAKVALEAESDQLMEMLAALDALCLRLANASNDQFSAEMLDEFLEIKQLKGARPQVDVKRRTKAEIVLAIVEQIQAILTEARRLQGQLEEPVGATKTN